jgi:ATP-dependent DNA helicase DinG
VIEVEVHQQLRQLLRQLPDAGWPHQLTMARMVARGLRLGRSTLIQVPSGGQHRLSYLLPALMWPHGTLLCAPASVQAQILGEEIPWLQQTLQLHKPVLQKDRWPDADFQGLLLVDPLDWLQARLRGAEMPTGIPLILDGAEDLEEWAYQVLTLTIEANHWQQLRQIFPAEAERISQAQVQLALQLLRRPLSRCLVQADEQVHLEVALSLVAGYRGWLPDPWDQLRRRLGAEGDPASRWVWWAETNRETGRLTLYHSPVALHEWLAPIWATQPVVIIGEALDLDRQAESYRWRLGLPDLTPLRFSSGEEWIRSGGEPLPSLALYLPWLPLPNSPLFREHLLQELKSLIAKAQGFVVVLVSDQPLQVQVGAALAAEFGSRVRVNSPFRGEKGILVCDWSYWLQHKASLPCPELLAIATLPFPSMEDPRVAARVQYLQRSRQDWFRQYLLPVAASQLQRAVAPLRQGSEVAEATGLPQRWVAILDSRIIARSYGVALLNALGPTLRIQQPSQLFNQSQAESGLS